MYATLTCNKGVNICSMASYFSAEVSLCWEKEKRYRFETIYVSKSDMLSWKWKENAQSKPLSSLPLPKKPSHRPVQAKYILTILILILWWHIKVVAWHDKKSTSFRVLPHCLWKIWQPCFLSPEWKCNFGLCFNQCCCIYVVQGESSWSEKSRLLRCTLVWWGKKKNFSPYFGKASSMTRQTDFLSSMKIETQGRNFSLWLSARPPSILFYFLPGFCNK